MANEPSVGAVEAARKINELERQNFGGHNLPPSSVTEIVESSTHAGDLREIAEYFVKWVDDVWGSAALSGKTLAEYERARAVLKGKE